MSISERIYSYMEKRGMSQIEFAHKTGISQSTISDWRRKGTNPSADKIMMICDVLNISPYELLTGVESKVQNKTATTDYFVIDKGTQEYQLIENYRVLDVDEKNRLVGYIEALKKCNR